MDGIIARHHAITPDERRARILVNKVSQLLSGGAALAQYKNNYARAALPRDQGHALTAGVSGFTHIFQQQRMQQ